MQVNRRADDWGPAVCSNRFVMSLKFLRLNIELSSTSSLVICVLCYFRYKYPNTPTHFICIPCYRTLFNYSSKLKIIIWCLFTSTFGCNDSHVRTSSINKRVDYYVKKGKNGLLLMEHQFYLFIISDRTKPNVWTILRIQWTFLDNIPFRLDRKKLI